VKREGLERDQKDIKERLESQVRQNREKEESVQTSFASLSEATMVAGTVVMTDGAPGVGLLLLNSSVVFGIVGNRARRNRMGTVSHHPLMVERVSGPVAWLAKGKGDGEEKNASSTVASLSALTLVDLRSRAG